MVPPQRQVEFLKHSPPLKRSMSDDENYSESDDDDSEDDTETMEENMHATMGSA